MPEPGRLPTFLVIGAMRCGTTGLARSLGAHPDAFVAVEKEVHFFDRQFDRGIDWYASRFTGAGDVASVGEATQTYLYDQVSLDRIVETLPEVRMVVLLRQPVDRAWSHYWLNRGLGSEPLDFAAAIEAEPERLARDRADRFTYSYLDRGRYAGQLDEVVARVGPERLHVELFDDLRDRPEETFKRICAFLGLEPMVTDVVGNQVNQQVQFRSLRLRQMAKRLPRPAARVIGRLNTRPGEYPEIDRALWCRLTEELAPELDRLESVLGRSLPPAWRP